MDVKLGVSLMWLARSVNPSSISVSLEIIICLLSLLYRDNSFQQIESNYHHFGRFELKGFQRSIKHIDNLITLLFDSSFFSLVWIICISIFFIKCYKKFIFKMKWLFEMLSTHEILFKILFKSLFVDSMKYCFYCLLTFALLFCTLHKLEIELLINLVTGMMKKMKIRMEVLKEDPSLEILHCWSRGTVGLDDLQATAHPISEPMNDFQSAQVSQVVCFNLKMKMQILLFSFLFMFALKFNSKVYSKRIFSQKIDRLY